MIKKMGGRKFLVLVGFVFVAVAGKQADIPSDWIEYLFYAVMGYLGVEGGLDFASLMKGIPKLSQNEQKGV